MQQNMLYEESAISTRSAREQKIWKTLHVLQWVFIVLSGISAMMLLLLVPNAIEVSKGNVPSLVFSLVTLIGGFLMLVLIAVIFWRFKLRYNVSYDYVFVEDELRVSKVFNGRKRKFLHNLKTDSMLKIGYCSRPSFESTIRGYDKKKGVKLLTPNDEPADDKDFIYIVYSTSIEKTVYVIECRQTMLEYLVRVAGRNKFETR